MEYYSERQQREGQTQRERKTDRKKKVNTGERDGEIWRPWLQRSASVHRLFGSRLERHATSNTVDDYGVQFSTV